MAKLTEGNYRNDRPPAFRGPSDRFPNRSDGPRHNHRLTWRFSRLNSLP